MLEEIMEKNGMIMGLCYMDVFIKEGWNRKIDFDCIIEGTLTGFVLTK